MEGDAPAPATRGRGRGQGGRRRGTSWHRDASAGYGSDLESLDFPADEPLEGHDVALLALNTKR